MFIIFPPLDFVENPQRKIMRQIRLKVSMMDNLRGDFDMKYNSMRILQNEGVG